MISRRKLLQTGLAGTLMMAAVTSSRIGAAQTSSKLKSAVNVDRQGVALMGYDPVAYFTAGKPIKGDAVLTATHAGATYRFASAANRDAFMKEPARYLPQYGGFCAYAVSKGYTAEIDPKAWKIVDGRLYLNYNASVAQLWSGKQAEFIKAADRNWPKMGAKAN